MKKYTPEYLYTIWLAVHLHFTEEKFSILTYPRVDRKPNARILARLRPIADKVPAKEAKKFIVANYIWNYREGGWGSSWLYEKGFPEMRDAYERYQAHTANFETFVYEDIVRLIMEHRGIDYLLDFEKKDLWDEFMNYDPGASYNRWDTLGYMHNNNDVPLMLNMFFAKRFNMETICYIMSQSKGKFWEFWVKQFGSNDSFPNYRKDFLFLTKYNQLLQRQLT